MNYILPPSLEKGETVGLVTPSSPLMGDRLEVGIKYFENKGYKVKLGKHNQKCQRFLAGSDKERAEDIMGFFKDPDCKAIVATGGGYGSQRLLPYLDYDVIKSNPKPLVGFSDTTALQLGILSQTGLVSYTGFTCGDIHDGNVDDQQESTLISCLSHTNFQVTSGRTLNPGSVTGPLIGGNLDLIRALIGTKYQPDFTGAILLIEEVRTEPYKLDSMLSSLELAGLFDAVSGVVFCHLEKCDANYFPERDGTSQDVIQEYADRIQAPCLHEFPHGHGSAKSVLPVGLNVHLNTSDCKLTVNF